MPGQMGLNAGILPSPGFTYVNMDINYDAGSYNNRNGKAIPVTGTYDVWAVENIFYYVFDGKVVRRKLRNDDHVSDARHRLACSRHC